MAGDMRLRAVIQAVDEFTPQMSRIISSIKQHNEELSKARNMLAIFGAAATGAMVLAVKSAADEEAGIVKLAKALDNVGVSYANVEKEIEATISATIQKTAIADNQQREALASLVAITGDYEKSLKLMGLTLDLATGKGIDYNSAAMIIGRVASGNTEILGRYGIQLKEGATATEALTALTQKFGGQAEAFGNTTAGQIKNIKNNLNDLWETIGKTLLPAVSDAAKKLNEMLKGFQDLSPEMKSFIGHGTAIAGVVSLILAGILSLGLALPGLIVGFKALGAAIAFMLGPVGLIILGLTAIGVAVGAIISLFAKSENEVKDNAKAFGDLALAIDDSGEIADRFTKNFEDSWIGIAKSLRPTTEATENWLKTTIQSFEKILEESDNLSEEYKKSLSKVINELKETEKATEDLIKTTISQLDFMGNEVVKALKARNTEMEKADIASIDARLEEYGIFHKERLKQIDKEAEKELETLAATTKAVLKPIQDKIDLINTEQKARDKATESMENAARREKLLAGVEEALALPSRKIFDNRWVSLEQENAVKVKEAKQALADFELALAQKAQKEKENGTIKSLQSDIKLIEEKSRLAEENITKERALRQADAAEKLEAKQKELTSERNAIGVHWQELNAQEVLQAEARNLMLSKNQNDLVVLLESYNPLWQNAGQSLGESLLNGLNSQMESITKVVNNILGMISSVEAAKQRLQNIIIGGGSGGGIPAPTSRSQMVPGLQHGGIITSPTLALVGEKESEAVIPLSRLKSNSGLTINFSGPIYGFDEFRRKVQEIVKTTKLAGGFRGVI